MLPPLDPVTITVAQITSRVRKTLAPKPKAFSGHHVAMTLPVYTSMYVCPSTYMCTWCQPCPHLYKHAQVRIGCRPLRFYRQRPHTATTDTHVACLGLTNVFFFLSVVFLFSCFLFFSLSHHVNTLGHDRHGLMRWR